MNEMEMEVLLKHPVVVEVINLVYESNMSVSSSIMGLSTTIQCLLEDDAMSTKPMVQKMIVNIQNGG